jgi:hypothetical protein
VAYFVDQARPKDDRRGTGAPLEWAILHYAERWHQHPADVDPTTQRPNRAKWFYWAMEAESLRAQLAPRRERASQR